jgi:hypothetical protein
VTLSSTSLGSLWRYVVSTGTGTTTAVITNQRSGTKWRSVAFPPTTPGATIVEPPPPAVYNTTLSVAEQSPVGTLVGDALGAALPASPSVAWELLSGGTNVTGNGVSTGVNGSVFAISTCGGQVVVAAPVLDYMSVRTFTLTVRAYIDDAAFNPPPQTIITVTIDVTEVPHPPVLAAPALVASLPEHSPAGTVIGPLSYTDRDGRTPGNFTWAVTSDPTGGWFNVTPLGVLTVSSAVMGTAGFNYATPTV